MRHIALTQHETTLLQEVRQLIASAQTRVAQTVNAELTSLYWQIGQRIHTEILAGQRAQYGQELMQGLAQHLTQEYGRSFAEKNLRRMLQFAQTFPDEAIVAALRRQLGWTHFKLLIPLKDPLQRDYYAQMCSIERWSTRTLDKQIQSMLFERMALSRQPDELIRLELDALRNEERLSAPMILKDPYILDFLGLQDRYLEKNLEDAILREMELFLLELGAGFSFVARQKRLQIDQDDFYIDLLFYNRKLKRLIAIELKIGDFKAEYKGQMELYLRYLAKHEQEPGENSPLGIILCTGKKQEQIELLELDKSGIHVAQYLTELPPREVLQTRLNLSFEQAQNRLANKGNGGDQHE